MATSKLALDNRPTAEAQRGVRPNAGKRLPAHQVFAQDLFLQMLHREKRRTERSGRAFLLVLISGHDLEAQADNFPAGAVAAGISSCIREIDMLGWYEHPTTLGVLMTEIGDPSADLIESVVRKMSLAIQQTVTADVYCRLTLVVRAFPADSGDKAFTFDPMQMKLGKRIDSALKRVIDILVSLIALIVLFPSFLLIAILIKCTSKGPVLFKKKRLGRFAKEFSFYKFRTMHANNDPEIHRKFVSQLIAGNAEPGQNGGLYKIANDPRITPIGRFLRRTSLDELPQFINVLLGDMSLVGPRPPLSYEYERYSAWHKRRVLELKPGITGLWQVLGRSRTTFDEMVRMDIRYAKTRNLRLDISIMLRTPAAMFSGRGAC